MKFGLFAISQVSAAPVLQSVCFIILNSSGALICLCRAQRSAAARQYSPAENVRVLWARARENEPPTHSLTHPPPSFSSTSHSRSLSLALLFPPFLCAPLIFCLKQFLPNCKFNILTQQFISDSQLMPLSLRARCHYYSYGDAYFALRERKLALGNGVWANVFFMCLEIFQIHQAELNEFSPEFGSLSINREIQSKTTILILKSNLKMITKLKKLQDNLITKLPCGHKNEFKNVSQTFIPNLNRLMLWKNQYLKHNWLNFLLKKVEFSWK